MSEVVTNIYKAAREYANMSRIDAAEALAISPSSLKDYEIGWRDCPDATALAMSKLYHAPWLRVQHLQRNVVFCDIFGIVPDMSSNAMNVLRAQKEVGEVVSLFPQIVEKAIQKAHLGSKLIQECREGAQALLVLVGMEVGQKEKLPCVQGSFSEMSSSESVK